MLQLSYGTPPRDKNAGLEIHRVPASARLTVVVTSEQLLGCKTHYSHGRTLPCLGQDCEACDDGLETRWHGYLSALHCKALEHFILDLPLRAAEKLTDYTEDVGSLRGCVIDAHRPSKTRTGRIKLTCRPAKDGAPHLPEALDVLAFLSRLWLIPLEEMNVAELPDARSAIRFDSKSKGHAAG